MTRAALKWVVVVACVVGAVSSAWAGIAPSPWKFNVTPAWASAPAGDSIPYTVVFEEMARGSSSCCNGAILPQEHRAGDSREAFPFLGPAYDGRASAPRVPVPAVEVAVLADRPASPGNLLSLGHSPYRCRLSRWTLSSRRRPVAPSSRSRQLLPDRRSPAVDVHRYMYAGAGQSASPRGRIGHVALHARSSGRSAKADAPKPLTRPAQTSRGCCRGRAIRLFSGDKPRHRFTRWEAVWVWCGLGRCLQLKNPTTEAAAKRPAA